MSRNDLRTRTPEQVTAMRSMYRFGMSTPEIAAAFNMNRRTVWSIIRGVTYADIPGFVRKHEVRR
jgi:predicted DNA-binding protein YlxM (UPF0122 family)